MKLKNFEKLPFEIATRLLTKDDKLAEEIISLLCDDSNNLSSFVTKTLQELIAEEYINFTPATESGIKDISRNTFLVINTEDFNFNLSDSNINVIGSIYITTDKSHYLLSDNSLRLLKLADAIISALDNEKMSSAGKISISSMNYVVFSEFRGGFRINFRCVDQPTKKAEL